MDNNYIIKHIRLNYDNNLCNCLKGFFVNNSNSILKELLNISRVNNPNTLCISNLIKEQDNKELHIVWVRLSPFSEGEIKHILLHSNIIRQRAQLDQSNLNFNYNEDIINYIKQLLKEILQYYFPCEDVISLMKSHKSYYQSYLNNCTNAHLHFQDENEFFSFVNPIFRFNYINGDDFNIKCVLQKKLQVLFMPDINNIAQQFIKEDSI